MGRHIRDVQHSDSEHKYSAHVLLEASATSTLPDALHNAYVVQLGAKGKKKTDRQPGRQTEWLKDRKRDFHSQAKIGRRECKYEYRFKKNHRTMFAAAQQNSKEKKTNHTALRSRADWCRAFLRGCVGNVRHSRHTRKRGAGARWGDIRNQMETRTNK